MAVREFWEIKWLEWINVQKDWVTEVSLTDTINIVGWWSVTDVGWVATINIPQWVTWYREDVPAGSATYTFLNSPATTTSFLVFTDSWTLMFLWIDYTYDPDTETITFLSLGNSEAAYIWVAHAVVQWGWIGDMVKAVYDPTNINASAFDYNNFINTPTIPAAQIQSDWTQSDNTKLDFIKNKPSIPDAQIQSDWSQQDNTKVDFIKNKPVIPDAQIQSDWLQQDNTKVDFIKNKPSIPAAQIQSDWSQADNTQVDYIKNKPTIPSVDWLVTWAASSTDWNIVVFDWATGKVIKDSWLNIQISNNPSWSICDVYYDNWTIYLSARVESYLLLESWDDILTEWGDKFVLE